MAARLAAGYHGSYNTWLTNCDQGSAGGTYYYTTIYGSYSRTAEQEEANKSSIHISMAITASGSYTCKGNWIGYGWLNHKNGTSYHYQWYDTWPANGVNASWHPVPVHVYTVEVTHNDDGTWVGVVGADSCDGPPQNSRPTNIPGCEIDVPPIDRTVSLSTVAASNPGETTASVAWTANKVCNKVEYQVNGGSWVTASTAEGSSGTFTASGLKEGSSNTINVRVTRKASGRTATKETTVTTLEGNNMRMKINGSWKKGKAYVKVNGAWKKATPYVKVNGSWKKSTS